MSRLAEGMGRSRSGVRAALLLALLCLACTTPYQVGERRYREGDRLAALETWRGVRSDSSDYARAQRRIQEVEAEFEQLVTRYKKRARYYEERGRLGESILNYRLALKLQTEDRATLSHVQELARTLDARSREKEAEFRRSFEAGDLAAARTAVEDLRRLDPFSPAAVADARQLDDALDEQIDRLLARGRRGFSSGNHASAEQAFREVLGLDPENVSAEGYLAYIARIREEEGQGGNAGVDARGVDASDAEIRAEGFYQNALKAERAGDPYAAIRYDLAALRADSEHARARRHLSGVRGALGPQVPQLIEEGRARYQEEELQAALDLWKRALLIEPGNAEAREYRRRAERLLENLDRLRADEPDSAVGSP